MRKFILHTIDKSKSFDLNGTTALAAEPTGLGNSFALSYKESAKGNHIVNVKPAFEPITLKIYFNSDGTNGYANYKALLSFFAACGGGTFIFEYNDGITDRFCDAILKSATKSEINEDGLFVETFTFERQTYYYEQINNVFEIVKRDNAASFPFGFPFGFAGIAFCNEYRVKNTFFIDAPILIKISGNIANNVQIYVRTLEGTIIAQIQLLVANSDGTTIYIDPTQKKIMVNTDDIIANGYGLTDKTKQSFLYLPQGEYYIGSNMQSTDGGKIEITIKRYLLD